MNHIESIIGIGCAMESQRPPKYITPTDLSAKYPAFTKTWLRHRLWRRDENGLSVAVKKIGRKFFIDEDKFFEWIESHGGEE
jgi:hypothetical protein